MNQAEKQEFQRFAESGVGELWKWVTGGHPQHLYSGFTEQVIEDFFGMLIEVVEAGAKHKDLLHLRKQLAWRLVQEQAGRRRRGPS